MESQAGPGSYSDANSFGTNAARAVLATSDTVRTPPDLPGATPALQLSAPPAQIVFIEANVPDVQDLLGGLQPGVEAVLLDPGQDGVQQIAAYLTSHDIQGLAGIDVVAHGADGEFELGTATLSSKTLADYQSALAQIGAALAPGGAIQIYGCDVGEGHAGVAFLDQLSQATGGANIAAASHLVGAAAGGGSFNLNVNVGANDVGTPFTSATLDNFQGELDPPLLYGQTIDKAGIVAASETVNAGVMTLYNSGGTDVGTIAVGTSLSTGDFILTSDGSGGTDVVVNTVFGTYTSGVTLLVNPATIASTAEVSGSLAGVTGAYGPFGTAWALTNLGTVSETGTFSFGVFLGSAGTITNAASAVIVGDKAGIKGDAEPITVVNSGSVGANLTASGVGVYLEFGGSVTNQSGGTITGYYGVRAAIDPVTVVNSGSIGGNLTSAHGVGVLVLSGGLVTNQSGGTISGHYGVLAVSDAVTVVNAGYIAGNPTYGSHQNSGVYLRAGGSVTNQSGGTIQAYYYGIKIAGASGTVLNLGDIAAASFFNGKAGVDLADGGVVTNGASGGTASSAYIGGYHGAIYSNSTNASTITNFGTFTGIYASTAIQIATGTVTNGPSGATGALINGGYQGVVISGAGTVVNYATITGQGAAKSSNPLFGVRLGGAGRISNLGAGSLIENYVGVYGQLNDTVTNAGTIASNNPTGIALLFGGGTNRLIVDPGASFVGTVSGGPVLVLEDSTNQVLIGTANGVGTTTLELASAAAVGTLSGLGTQFVGFAAVTIDSGANWTFSGANTLDAGVTLADSGSLTVAETMTNQGSIMVDPPITITGTFVNSAAVSAASAQTAVYVAPGGMLTNLSTATIGGGAYGVTLTGGPLTNAGRIEGSTDAVLFAAGAGNRLIVDAGGTFTGTVDGGNTIGAAQASTLELASGASAGTLSGLGTQFVDFAQVTVDAAATWTLSGTSSGFATLINAGTLQSGITLGSGSFTVSNDSGGTIITGGDGIYALGTVAVMNAGIIHGYGANASYSGVLLATGGSVINQSGGTISGFRGIYAQGAAVTVVNAGSIYGNTTDGLQLNAGGSVSNQSGGTISGGIYGIDDAAFAATVVNAGSIGGNAVTGVGIDLQGGGSVTNQTGGTITGLRGVYVSRGAAGTVLNAGSIGGDGSDPGIQLADGGSVTNQSGGVITGYQGIFANTLAATVINAGSIGGNSLHGEGVYLSAGGAVTNLSTGRITGNYGIALQGGLGTLVNAGTLIGYIGSSSVHSAAGFYGNGGGLVTNQSGGVITGFFGVGERAAALTVQNAGSIGGNGTVSGAAGAYLGAGGSVTNRSGGAITGYYGVEVSGALATVVNAGSIGGNAVTGVGTDLQGGGTITNQPGGTISGGAYAVKFSAGATGLLAIDPGATFVGTVTGGNTVGGAFVSTLELASSGSAGTLSSLGAKYIDFAQVTIDAGADWVFGGSNTLVAGATLTNSGTLTDSGMFTNAGLVTGAARGVLLTTGAYLTNQSGGTITGTYAISASGAASVVNAGSIGGTGNTGQGIYLQAGGSVTNQSGGTITGTSYGIIVSNAAGTVSNAGHIIGANSGASSGIAVQLLAGSVTNLSGGIITGEGLGIRITNGGYVTNASGGSITGGDGVYSYSGPFTLANAGTITGTGTNSSNGGAYLWKGGFVSNASGGTISGYSNGIIVYNAAGTVINAGAIAGTNASGVWLTSGGAVTNQLGGTITGAQYGVFASNGTVTNAGTIESSQGTTGVAVKLAGDSARLIDDPSAVFIGSIDGGSGVLELASGSSAGTITGLGSSVTNFTSLVFDDGAQWTVGGSDAANVLDTLGIGGFTSGDTIDLTGFVAVGQTFASNTLVLTDGDSTHETLNIQGAFATSNFLIGPDGSGGTDITFQSPPTITAGGTVSFDGGGPAAVLDSTLSITDPNSGTLVSGTISIGTGFIAGDTLNFTGAFGITGSFDVSDGALTLSGTASVTDYQAALDSITYSFSPTDGDLTAGGTDTSRTIDWMVNDGTVDSAVGTSILDVTHNPPVIGGTATGQAMTDEAALDPFAGVTITDPNISQTETVTITLSNTANGTLSNLDGGTFNNGTYMVTGTTLAVTTAVDGLVFTPTAHHVAPGDTVTTTFTINTTDRYGNSATDSTTTVIATAVDDPPAITGTAANQAANDDVTVLPFPDVTVTDPDAGASETVSITLTDGGVASDANGTLSGTGLTKTGIGTYTLTTGTPGVVTSALDAVVFTPTAHEVAPGDTITTGMTLAVTDGIVASPVTDTTTTVVAIAVNDQPAISGTAANQAVNDDATALPFAGVTVTDPDVGASETVSITLTDGGVASDANGTLSGTGLTKTGIATYTLTTGTPGAVTSTLDAIVFTPTAHEVAPGDTITTGVTLAVTDGIVASSVTDTVTTVVAAALNDSPAITGTAADQAVNDDATALSFAGVTVTDPDVGASETVSITLTDGGAASDANGTLSGTGLTKTGIGTYTLTTGTPGAVTSALDAIVFTPTAHEVAPGDTITTGMTLAVTDGIVASPVTDTTTTVITTAVNDPPAITGTAADQPVDDDVTVLPFAGVTVTDPDAGASETVSIVLADGGVASDANGTLSGTGLTKTGIGTYTLTTGTLGAVTSALDAVVFTPTAHEVAPSDTITTGLTLAVTDGIVASPVTDTTTTVVATAANDPPVIANAEAGQTTTDEAAVAPFFMVSISDIDYGQTETVTVTLATPANGTLSTLDGGSYDGVTGVYSVTGTDATVTEAVDGLVFTPTEHQVAPGSTVTTTFTIKATDTAGDSSSNSTTTVIATAVNDPPVITQATASLGVPNENASALFASLTVTDPDVGHIDTLTVTMSNSAGGAFSDLSGGSYDASTRSYTFIGSALQVTAALQALVFTPAAPASGFVASTTDFSVVVTGSGGTATNDAISATAVAQVFGLGSAPTGDDAISVSPDGSSFPAPVDGDNNEAVVTNPSSGATYALPSGYQAEFLGGTAGATLSDPSASNALLIGNNGNDTLTAAAGNDTLVGGTGDNLLSVSGAGGVIDAGSGMSTVDAAGANDTVFAGSGMTSVFATGSHANVLGSPGGLLSVLDTGSNDTIGAFGALPAVVSLVGSSGLAFAGSNALTASVGGTSNTLVGGSGSMSATLSGSAGNVFGGSGTLSLYDGGSSDTIAAFGASSANVSLAGSGALLFGGSNSISVTASNSSQTIVGASGAASISITNIGSPTDDEVLGGSGGLTVDDEGQGDTIASFAASPANVTLGGQSTGDLLFGGSTALNATVAGANDTVVGGAGPSTIDAQSGAIVFGGSGPLSFVGGAGTSTIMGASGGSEMVVGSGGVLFFAGADDNPTIVGGSGATTVVGGTGSSVVFSSLSGSGGLDFLAGSGNESLDAANSSTSHTFGFFDSATSLGGGAHDTVTGWSAQDSLFLVGYDATTATTIDGGGNFTINLTHGATITFTDADSSTFMGRMLYVPAPA